MRKFLLILIPRYRYEIIIGGCALAALILFLWVPALRNSEPRWARTVQEMLLSGDWLQSSCNGEIGFDKPALSYWLAAGVSWAAADVSEWSIRLPSVIAAMILLCATIKLARMLFGPRTGIIAGWLTAGACTFLALGRSAGADMESCAAIMLATAWMYSRRTGCRFGSYMVFYLICLSGALAKGLPALAVPLTAAIVLLAGEKLLARHFNLSHLAAFFLCSMLFAAVPVLVLLHKIPDNGLNVLEYIWEENLLRVFRGTTHCEGWYFYLAELPRLTAPWTLLAAAAVWRSILDFRKGPAANRALLILCGVLLVMFSIPWSKRWYYLAPMVPFLLILTAAWLDGAPSLKWEERLLLFMRYAALITGSMAVLSIGLLPVLADRMGVTLPPLLLFGLPVCGILTLAAGIFSEGNSGGERMAKYFGLPPAGAGMIVCWFLISGGIFSCVIPGTDNFRTTKEFVRSKLAPLAENFAERDIILLSPRTRGDLVYYLDRSRPITYFSVWDDDGSLNRELLESFYSHLDARRKEEILLLSDRETAEALKTELAAVPGLTPEAPDLREPDGQFEQTPESKIVGWILKNQKDPRTP